MTIFQNSQKIISEQKRRLAISNRKILELKVEILSSKRELNECSKGTATKEDESKLPPWKGWGDTEY